MDAYARTLSTPGAWAKEVPGLHDAVQRWSQAPRSPRQLVGSLHRPGPAALRATVRASARLPAVNLRWARASARRSDELFNRGSPTKILRALGLDYAIDSAVSSGPGGRAALGLLRTVAPGMIDDRRADDLAPPPPMPAAAVRSRMDIRVLNRLRDLADVPFAVTEYDQMHQAVLDDGRECVVIASRPGVAGRIIDDAHLIAPWLLAVELIDRSPWRAGSVEILRNAVAGVVRRCDQQAVALDAVVLSTALEAAGIDDVRVAQPVPELVDRRSAVFIPPVTNGRPLDIHQVIGPGLAATIETGLLQGVYLTHADRQHLVGDSDGVTALVGGTTIGLLPATVREAFVSLLTGSRDSGPIDALVALEVIPPFVDRESLARLLAESSLLDPMSLVLPGGDDRRRRAARELVVRHGLRPTPALTGFVLALLRVIGAVQNGQGPMSVPKLAMHALPRLAGIGARAMNAGR